MSSAAQRNDMVGLFDYPQAETESTPVLREAVAERLRAHRSRAREAQIEQESARELAGRERTEARQAASRVREAVAARYQASQSYREFLAAEAERALQQAQAEADMAARKVKAVAEVQLQLLEELKEWKPEDSAVDSGATAEKAEARSELAHALADLAMGARELIAEPVLNLATPVPLEFTTQSAAQARKPGSHSGEVSTGNFTVRLYEDIGSTRVNSSDLRMSQSSAKPVPAEFEMNDLEDEIDFRRTPEFEPHIIETTPIPANLIEFPRQLIAPRKARPRLAEGPLREDLPAEPQLRIFEVEAEQISIEPALMEATSVAEWQTLLLDGNPARVPDAPAAAQTQFALQPQIAPLEQRLMAAAVDGCCLLGAFAAFACIFVEIAGPAARNIPSPMIAASAAGVLGIMFVLYQMLFFSLSVATPGMRYARIGLCTFSDENPTRKAMRRRILATLVAACPLGMGLVWAFLDDDSLGWHDRMSRMYQRGY